MHLRNTDGEEFLASNAVYRILDEAALTLALENCPEMKEDVEGGRFVWLRADPGGETDTVLGSIRIQGEQLTLDCNSRQRLESGKKLLAGLAGAHLKHLRDEFTSQQELKRRAREQPPRDEPDRDEIPSEVQRQLVTEFMERNIAEWPDRKIPALGGKTPREAVKTAAGRRKVEALLRDFENNEEHKRLKGKPSYDVDRVREELGIK